MLDIGWQELLVIGALALLVVGPKELPGLLRSVGRYAGKARSMAREFQRSMEDAAREADLEEFNKLKNAKRDFENMAKLDLAEPSKPAKSGTAGGSSGSGTETAAPAETPKAGAPAPAPAPAPEAAKPAAPAPTPSTAPAPATSPAATAAPAGETAPPKTAAHD